MTIKHIEKKIERLGYKLVENNKLYTSFEKFEPCGQFTHVVAICHKSSGKHIVQSYDKSDDTLCGLTYTEMMLFAKLMKKMWGKS